MFTNNKFVIIMERLLCHNIKGTLLTIYHFHFHGKVRLLFPLNILYQRQSGYTVIGFIVPKVVFGLCVFDLVRFFKFEKFMII